MVVGRAVSHLVTELFWYRALGLEGVFWTRWWAGVGVRSVAGLLVALVVAASVGVAVRSLGPVRVRRRFGNLEIEEQLPRSYVRAAVAAAALLSGWWLSVGVGDPVEVLAAVRAPAWGETDPVFGRDLSFYVHLYPLLQRFHALGWILVFWTALLTAVAYVAAGAIQWGARGPRASRAARRHLGLFAAAAFLLLGWGFWLGRYAPLFSGGGVGGVLGYTDAAVGIPASQFIALLAVLAAGAVGYGIWVGRLRLPAAAVGVLLVAGVVGKLALPALVQRFRVEPNEFARESRFIDLHLEFTRRGYGIAGLERRPLPYQSRLPESSERLLAALEQLPLWDSRPLETVFNEEQALFPYYTFQSVQYDRYGPPGEEAQVAISVRELDTGQLASTARTWQNLHLNYVRGEGAVVVPAAEMRSDGAPVYWLSDILPSRLSAEAPPALSLTDPRIHFGELSRGYVVLAADEGQGVAAPRMGGFWRRLAFSWAFQSVNLLFSNEVRPESRILYQRQLSERAARAAPFLHFPEGSAPLPVIFEERVVWMLDGYTVATDFPLSVPAPFGGRVARYLRNSVKATVDAVSGEVAFYRVVDDDPLLDSYERVFPGLVRPVSEMPAGLRRHLRYPTSLFELQALVLREYHLDGAREFYNKSDVWELPTEIYQGGEVAYRPFHATIPLPGEPEPSFVLSTGFTPSGRQTLTALLVTRNHPSRYGEQTLYELPRDVQVPGPQQVEAMIDQSAEISEQLALWSRGGSRVLRGHMVAVPFQGSVLYVEPLFLEAEEDAIPQLERVIVVGGGRVAMRPTLTEAVDQLLAGPGEDVAATPDDPAAPSPSSQISLERARRLLQEAELRLRRGDWTGFGEVWRELRRVLAEDAP